MSLVFEFWCNLRERDHGQVLNLKVLLKRNIGPEIRLSCPFQMFGLNVSLGMECRAESPLYAYKVAQQESKL